MGRCFKNLNVEWTHISAPLSLKRESAINSGGKSTDRVHARTEVILGTFIYRRNALFSPISCLT